MQRTKVLVYSTLTLAADAFDVLGVLAGTEEK